MRKPKIDTDALREHRWKDFLLSMPPGEHECMFSSINEIESMRSVGTKLNSYGIYENIYKFSPAFRELKCKVNVIKRDSNG